MQFLIRTVRAILSSCRLFISFSLMGHIEKAGIHQSLKNFLHDTEFMHPLPLLLDHCEHDKREPYREAIILSK